MNVLTTDTSVMDRLGAGCRDAGLDRLAERMAMLRDIAATDLRAVEAALAELPVSGTVVVRGALHLVALGGKRLRPLCVALAARAGRGFGPAAHELAVAVELVHNATLLHDDVVDLGDVRRGAPTTRALYGNAASIFAGDWLLTEALRRVRRADVPGTLDRLLDVIQDMIAAESQQLENRGRLVADRGDLQAVHRRAGKTAALFRWAMDAGARAGGLAEPHCQALEACGASPRHRVPGHRRSARPHRQPGHDRQGAVRRSTRRQDDVAADPRDRAPRAGHR